MQLHPSQCDNTRNLETGDTQTRIQSTAGHIADPATLFLHGLLRQNLKGVKARSKVIFKKSSNHYAQLDLGVC